MIIWLSPEKDKYSIAHLQRDAVLTTSLVIHVLQQLCANNKPVVKQVSIYSLKVRIQKIVIPNNV